MGLPPGVCGPQPPCLTTLGPSGQRAWTPASLTPVAPWRALGSAGSTERPPGLSRAGRMDWGSSCQSSEGGGSSPTPRPEAPPLGSRHCGLFGHKSYWGGHGAFHFSSHSHSLLGPERVWLREGACGQGAPVGSHSVAPGRCGSKMLPAASSPVCSPSRRWACFPGRGRGHVRSFVS